MTWIFLETIYEGRLAIMDIEVEISEKIKNNIKKYGNYIDLFEHGTEKEIEVSQ